MVKDCALAKALIRIHLAKNVCKSGLKQAALSY